MISSPSTSNVNGTQGITPLSQNTIFGQICTTVATQYENSYSYTPFYNFITYVFITTYFIITLHVKGNKESDLFSSLYIPNDLDAPNQSKHTGYNCEKIYRISANFCQQFNRSVTMSRFSAIKHSRNFSLISISHVSSSVLSNR
jgi:hypothetical protein